jgi:hypothetical protein
MSRHRLYDITKSPSSGGPSQGAAPPRRRRNAGAERYRGGLCSDPMRGPSRSPVSSPGRQGPELSRRELLRSGAARTGASRLSSRPHHSQELLGAKIHARGAYLRHDSRHGTKGLLGSQSSVVSTQTLLTHAPAGPVQSPTVFGSICRDGVEFARTLNSVVQQTLSERRQSVSLSHTQT